jgi:signal transduction histidine kinase
MSTIAIKQTDLPLAVSLLKEAIVFVKSCKNSQERFVRTQRYLDDLGYVYNTFRKYDSAFIYHLAAIKYITENKKLYISDTLFPYSALQNIYGNIAIAYAMSGDLPKAEEYTRKELILAADIFHDTVEVAASQSILAEILYRSGRIDEANTYADKALPQIKNFDLSNQIDLLRLKSDITKSRLQYKQEAKFREQLAVVKDSLAWIRIQLLRKNPFTEYEKLDKKYQVELLKKDNRIQQNKTNAAIVIGSLLTLLAIISLYLIWRLRTVMKKRSLVYKKLVASEKELKETMLQKEMAEKQLREKELFALEMQLQMEFNESILQQRRQISDDMHDELSSSLAALKYYVEDVKNKSVGTTVEKSLLDLTEEVNSVYKNARNYMHGLKTNNWETQFSLIGFLKELQQKFFKKGLMDVKLTLAEQGIKSLLSTYQHDQLYHIVKEAISNVIKHASATQLSITVGFSENACICIITDNGIGFNEATLAYGIGIQSIKNRINDLEGTVEVTSTQNGVYIKVEFPLY